MHCDFAAPSRFDTYPYCLNHDQAIFSSIWALRGSIKTTCSVGLAWILASQRLNWARFCCVEHFMAAHLFIATFELTTSFVRKMFDFIYIYVENIPFLIASSNRKHVESQRAALPVALWGL